MIKNPKHGLKWIYWHILKLKPIDVGVPWISWPAIEHLQDLDMRNLNVFEWGGGGSTIFFTSKGAKVTTVESNEHWKGKIEDKLKQIDYSQKTVIEFIPIKDGNESTLNNYIKNVNFGGPYDIILVDGIENFNNFDSEYNQVRIDCLKEAMNNLSTNGVIIFDDPWRKQYQDVPTILDKFQRLQFIGVGPGRPGVTQTDIYYKGSLDIDNIIG